MQLAEHHLLAGAEGAFCRRYAFAEGPPCCFSREASLSTFPASTIEVLHTPTSAAGAKHQSERGVGAVLSASRAAGPDW
ncbi:hypothetical protein EON81_24875 [bacterium]|nr:MAG: hypothetical protein EON81_24875 [bacterium]